MNLRAPLKAEVGGRGYFLAFFVAAGTGTVAIVLRMRDAMS
jgi:hypothetical protein